MRLFRSRVIKRLAATFVATTSLLVVGSTAARADSDIPIYMFGRNAVDLGFGWWQSAPVGDNRNGRLYVYDDYPDGAVGIILELSKWTASGWSRVNLVSVRGAGLSNTNHVKSELRGGPRFSDADFAQGECGSGGDHAKVCGEGCELLTPAACCSINEGAHGGGAEWLAADAVGGRGRML